MGRYEFADNFVAGLGAIYGESMKFFNRSLESRSLLELIDCGEVPQIAGTLGEGEAEALVQMPAGDVRTRYRVMQRASDDAPVLIFHHGSGDQPYYTRIEKIMRSAGAHKPFRGITVIATDSPFNRTRREYVHAIGDLASFATIFAASTLLVEGLVRNVRRRVQGRLVVSGISLGGWICNLHHTTFNSADEYRPVFAGAAPDALFLNSGYSRLTSSLALRSSSRLTRVLNFEDVWADVPNDNVHALLARFDQYVKLERQRSAYRDENVTVMDRGHVTGSSAGGEIAQFIAAGLHPCALRSDVRTGQG